MSWEITYYETPSGQAVIKDFIDNLEVQTQAKLARKLDLLEEHGNELGMPHARPMGGGLTELRVRGRQEVRVFYIFAINGRIYLLHAFVKKTQTTPTQELSIAYCRQKEIKKRNLYGTF